MELFKSIFASDEEPDDDEEELEEEPISMEPPPPPAENFRPSVVHDSDGGADNHELATEVKPVDKEPEPQAPSAPPAADLSVHQLFKHLFNPAMDTGTFHS